ncbi:hypothetical protein [Actinophytocola sp. NPDC049390]|uniref:hypothetical protein n=1 Tax=Actinophytocola sp. NPDC049390 TaxID=3363894 RepID=UPI003794D8C1
MTIGPPMLASVSSAAPTTSQLTVVLVLPTQMRDANVMPAGGVMNSASVGPLWAKARWETVPTRDWAL